MATAYVTIGTVVVRDIFNGDDARSEIITTSGAAANGALTAVIGQVAMISCATHLYAKSGPGVTAANGVYVPADTPTYIAMTEGAVVSLIDAA